MFDPQIVKSFKKTKSIEQTAAQMNVSVITVRRTLITAGVWSSRRSREVGDLITQGLSKQEIAQQLFITEKAVEAYSPYKK